MAKCGFDQLGQVLDGGGTFSNHSIIRNFAVVEATVMVNPVMVKLSMDHLLVIKVCK